GEFRFVKKNSAVPAAAERLLPLPSRDRERITGEFPSMIDRPPEGRGGFQHLFHSLHMAFDADAARLRAQVLSKGNVRGVLHQRRHAPFFWRDNIARRAAESDAYRL